MQRLSPLENRHKNSDSKAATGAHKRKPYRTPELIGMGPIVKKTAGATGSTTDILSTRSIILG